MNNSCTTVDVFDEYDLPEVHASTSWQGKVLLSSKTQNWTRLAKNISIAAVFAISPITAIYDPWLIEKKQRNAVVTMSVYKEIIGRFISRSEALKLARQILVDAEQERLAVAEFEAAKGIQWEEGE